MSELTEITTSLGALSTFFSNQGKYVAGFGTLPDPATLSTSMTYDELLTYAYLKAQEGSDYPIGVAQEVIATNASVNREIDIAQLSKASIYNNHQGESSGEATYYSQSMNFYLGVLKGAPTNGSQC